MQEDDVVGQALRLAEVVRRHHDRRAARMHARGRSLSTSRVAPGSRLAVGSSRNSTSGSQRPGAREREALLLAARQHARRAIARARRGRRRASASRARIVALGAAARRRASARRRRCRSAERRSSTGPLEHHRLSRGPPAAPARPTSTVPAVGASRPCSRRSSTLLPAPLAPRITVRGPALDRERRCRRGSGARRASNATPSRRSGSSDSGGACRRLSRSARCAASSHDVGAGVQREHDARAARCRAPSASGRSPLLVSSAIAVVITRVTPSMLPPTIITAPTSAIARPKPASTTVDEREAHVPQQRQRGAAARRAERAQLLAYSRHASSTTWRESAAIDRQDEDRLRDHHRRRREQHAPARRAVRRATAAGRRPARRRPTAAPSAR